MKAARIHRYGPPDVLTIDEIPRPIVGPKDVLVAVHAASVNPVDWKIRKGYQRALIRYRLPHTLGLDAAGAVVQVGSKVKRVAVGDRVYSSPTHRRAGTYAEFVAIDEKEVAKAPAALDFQQAASMPLAGLTAHQALVDAGRVQPGERVLIQAGAGGVGTLAIQLAKHLGAHVITTCSAPKIDFVKSLGADEVVDYRQERFDEVLDGIDVVLDTLGGEARDRAIGVLRPGGRLVSVVSDMPHHVTRRGPALGTARAIAGLGALAVKMRALGKHYHYVLRSADARRLETLGQLVEDGALRPVIDRVFPLRDIVKAHRYSETGRARGKIVIQVR